MNKKKIHWVEIENFKTFGSKIHIDLNHPAVLIGPNNAGKTSVIQALALWSRGIKGWYEKKGSPKSKKGRERLSAGINRLELFEIPITDTRSLWKDTKVVRGTNEAIPFSISVGLEINGKLNECKLIFTRRDSETIYCKPDKSILNEENLLSNAATYKFNLLYPMSGIETEETLLPEGRINVLMGQGQTAQVLRNLCYMIVENDPSDWEKISKLVDRLFLVRLKKPQFNQNRGNIILNYNQSEISNELDISQTGRGLQQLLLILAYLYSHKSSILLIDEPDAHLEILRQRQVYEILKQIAEENYCQVIIATHSEVILEDAVDSNLTLLLNGEAVDIASQTDMKKSLRSFGIEHYVKAKINPKIIYVESSTDLEILKRLAKLLDHKSYEILSLPINYYYTQNPFGEESLENKLDRIGGSFADYRSHFFTLKKYIPDLVGFGIFDSDGRNYEVRDDSGLLIRYWQNYEIENYFISPELLLQYIDLRYKDEGALFKPVYYESAKKIIDSLLLEYVFDHNNDLLDEYKNSSNSMKHVLLKNTKISVFCDNFFKKFRTENSVPILLNKGQYYELIDLVNKNDISEEFVSVLDDIYRILQ